MKDLNKRARGNLIKRCHVTVSIKSQQEKEQEEAEEKGSYLRLIPHFSNLQ